MTIRCHRHSAWMAALMVLMLGLPGQGQSVITGDGLPYSGFSSLSRESSRVLQQFYDDVFFASITQPTPLLAMSFRLPAIAGTDYPALGEMNFGRYDITLAKASAASAAANGLTSATFADNMVDPVLVRSGPLSIPQGSFVSNPAGVDAEFSFHLIFDTPYLYTPGDDLVMLVRHDGHGDVNGQETRWNFDGYAWANGTIVSTVDVNALVANFGPGDFNVANRVEFVPTPEPTGGLLTTLGVVAIGAIRRRRNLQK